MHKCLGFMYQIDWVSRIRSGGTEKFSWSTRLAVSQTVWKLGFTSLFTDVSSEMVASILPLYLVFQLHFSPLQFGFLDGISQGAAVALLSLASGILADRWRRQKEVATLGYALSALSRAALLWVGGAWTLIAGILAMDRVGKGVRTAPRDAMISLASRCDQLATAFSVHRGLDAGGAVFGPLVAFLLLRLVPGAFDLVLMASLCFALVGLGVIVLLVERPCAGGACQPAAISELRISHHCRRGCLGLVVGKQSELPGLKRSLALLLQPRFRALAIAGGLLGLATASDGFVYLLLQRNTHSAASAIPLYAFLTAIVYLLLSVPAGRLADQVGRRRMFLGGYGLLILVYGLLLTSGLGSQAQFLVIGLFGAYYAATDGVLAAMASATLDAELRTSGLALLNTVTSISRLVSSVSFGWLWTSGSPRTAVWSFLLGLSATMIISGLVFVQTKRGLNEQPAAASPQSVSAAVFRVRAGDDTLRGHDRTAVTTLNRDLGQYDPKGDPFGATEITTGRTPPR